MEFNEHKPIYLQIADTLTDRILSGELVQDDRIPSVRELGQTLGVNPNTIVRSYEYLQHAEIIYNKRGLGYFVSPNAKGMILQSQRDRFKNEELPELFRKINLLGFTVEEVSSLYMEFINKEK